jgi:hypothetical protein
MGQSPPISSRSSSTVLSAGTQAIAVIEADGCGRHKHPPEIDRGTQRADPAYRRRLRSSQPRAFTLKGPKK